MNLTMLKTERYSSCLADISEVVHAAEGIPVKVIIEACLLLEDEICRASELAVKAGAAYVKTGTGWVGPASVKQVELIYQTIGNEAFIKAAGGIRSLSDVRALYQAGCDRFGVGASAAVDILNEACFQ
jgi:deoxyribose-phosphate aldolase